MTASVSLVASPIAPSPQLSAAPKSAFVLPQPVMKVRSNSTSISGSSVVSAALGGRTSSAYSSTSTSTSTVSQTNEPGMNSQLAQSQSEMRDLINLQIAMQRENQYFTTISNILKTRHETLKTIIGNIR